MAAVGGLVCAPHPATATATATQVTQRIVIRPHYASEHSSSGAPATITVHRATCRFDRSPDSATSYAIRVFPGWGVASREAVLSGVAKAETWTAFTIEDPEAILLGDHSAALVYRTAAERATGPPYEAAFTSVYRRRDGSWELVVHHQTPLSAG